MHRDQRYTRLFHEGAKRLHQRGLAGGARQGAEEVLRGRIPMLMRQHVLVNAALKDLFAHVGLEHGQDAAALLVGDRVESAGDTRVVVDRLANRPPGALRVDIHGPERPGDQRCA